MAYGVRKWPNSNDPRDTGWMPDGWEWGAIPAYKYVLKTTEAIGHFAPLNDGVTVNLFLAGVPTMHFRRLLTPGDPLALDLFISGFQTVQPVPINHTVWWYLSAAGGFFELYTGNAYGLYPNAIENWPTLEMVVQEGEPDEIPNPIEIIPQRWDALQIP